MLNIQMHGKQPLKDAHFGTIHNQNQHFSPQAGPSERCLLGPHKFAQTAMAREGQTISYCTLLVIGTAHFHVQQCILFVTTRQKKSITSKKNSKQFMRLVEFQQRPRHCFMSEQLNL